METELIPILKRYEPCLRQDSIFFARDFESRPGGLVSWCMIEGADHMFKGVSKDSSASGVRRRLITIAVHG